VHYLSPVFFHPPLPIILILTMLPDEVRSKFSTALPFWV